MPHLILKIGWAMIFGLGTISVIRRPALAKWSLAARLNSIESLRPMQFHWL